MPRPAVTRLTIEERRANARKKVKRENRKFFAAASGIALGVILLNLAFLAAAVAVIVIVVKALT